MSSTVTMIQFPGIPNAYIAFSTHASSENSNKVKQIVTYVAVSEDKSHLVEWEPEEGPILFVSVAVEQGIPENDKVTHWYFPGQHTVWDSASTLVEDLALPELLIKGDYAALFAQLQNLL